MASNAERTARQALYAAAGVADLAVSALRHLPKEAEKLRARLPGEAAKAYDTLVKRGETLVKNVRKSPATKQAAQATRVAVSRTKAASSRVREGARTTRATARGTSTTVTRADQSGARTAKDAWVVSHRPSFGRPPRTPPATPVTASAGGRAPGLSAPVT